MRSGFEEFSDAEQAWREAIAALYEMTCEDRPDGPVEGCTCCVSTALAHELASIDRECQQEPKSAPGSGSEKCTTEASRGDASEWRGGEAVGRAGAALGRVRAVRRRGCGVLALGSRRVIRVLRASGEGPRVIGQ